MQIQKSKTTFFAYFLMLTASILPDILFIIFSGSIPAWLQWAKLGLSVIFLLGSFILPVLSSLRRFILVLLLYLAGSTLISQASLQLPVVSKLLGDGAFIRQTWPVQLAKLPVTLLILGTLLLTGYNFRQLFLVRGNLKQPITPVPWMGFPKPDSWVSFGGQWSIYLALGTGVGLWLTSRTTLPFKAVILPALPAILLVAALNAFNEEALFRSAILSTTEHAIGTRHAWAISAIYFGIAHFWGVPYGWLGVALASLMGWILSKAMLETRGFFWSWWIHFLQDVVIFIFIAANAVTPGG